MEEREKSIFMRKRFCLAFLFLLLFFSGCWNNASTYDINEIADLIVEEITLPEQTSEDLNFKSSYRVKGIDVEVRWIPRDQAVIDAKGSVTKGLTTREVDIEIEVIIDDDRVTRYLGTVQVLPLSDEELLDVLKQLLDVPEEAEDYINFPTQCEIAGVAATLSWHSGNTDAITDNGIVKFAENDQYVNFELDVITDNGARRIAWGDIKVPGRSHEEHIEFVIDKITIPESANADFWLPFSLYDVNINWSSSDTRVLGIDKPNRKAVWKFNETDKAVVLTAHFFYNMTIVTREYNVTVLTIPHEERMEACFDSVSLPEAVNSFIVLPTEFEYGVTGEWISDKPDIISPDGIVTLAEKEQIVTLTLKLYSGNESMTKEYRVTTEKIGENEKFINLHYLVDYAEQLDLSDNHALMLQDDRVVLKPGVLEGYYESPVYRANPFKSLVGSWAAISGEKATVELKVRVRVDGTWSSYLTYSSFGLGLENAMIPNQAGGVARMSQDEILINDNKTAEAFQYQVILRRSSLADDSPRLALVAAALEIENYQYKVDVSGLPDKYDHEVPQLNQNDVPNIGNQICSPTSSTMLLMFKGHEFSEAFPHEKNARLFRDYGNKIYGNWVYNTVGMSAYGEKSYVKRVYSWEELQYHLVHVGPVALSIKGNTGRYHTNGHLLVVRGYDMSNGKNVVICNDPNLPEVKYEYPLSVFLQFTRNVIYVVE